MFGAKQNGANAYANVGLESGVAAASPHKLITMLFEGAMVAITSAIHHMQTGNVAGKGQAISKAISIVDNGLRASLDKSVGGEIALNLDALYEYISNRLLIANIKNQQTVLEEIYQLLKGLKDAWEAIAPSQAMPAPTAQPAAPATPVAASPAQSPSYDSLTPKTSRLVKA